MDSIPPAALPLLLHLAPAFTRPTFRRGMVLLFATLLTTGRRTVHNLLRTVGLLAPGDSSSYRRVLSEASWSGLRVAAALTRFVVVHFASAGVLHVVGDDTVDEHRGKKVHGKARHRDPVRSSHSYTTYRYGHKWVVVALLVRSPGRRASGPCPCWSSCTARRRTTSSAAGGTRRRQNWCNCSCAYCCAGCPAEPSCSPATAATAATS